MDPTRAAATKYVEDLLLREGVEHLSALRTVEQANHANAAKRLRERVDLQLSETQRAVDLLQSAADELRSVRTDFSAIEERCTLSVGMGAMEDWDNIKRVSRMRANIQTTLNDLYNLQTIKERVETLKQELDGEATKRCKIATIHGRWMELQRWRLDFLSKMHAYEQMQSTDGEDLRVKQTIERIRARVEPTSAHINKLGDSIKQRTLTRIRRCIWLSRADPAALVQAVVVVEKQDLFEREGSSSVAALVARTASPDDGSSSSSSSASAEPAEDPFGEMRDLKAQCKAALRESAEGRFNKYWDALESQYRDDQAQRDSDEGDDEHMLLVAPSLLGEDDDDEADSILDILVDVAHKVVDDLYYVQKNVAPCFPAEFRVFETFRGRYEARILGKVHELWRKRAQVDNSTLAATATWCGQFNADLASHLATPPIVALAEEANRFMGHYADACATKRVRVWLRNAWKLNRALDRDYDTEAWFSAAPQLTVSLVREAIRAATMQGITGHELGGYMCAMLGTWADVAVQHGREAELAALEADVFALDPSRATAEGRSLSHVTANNPYIDLASGSEEDDDGEEEGGREHHHHHGGSGGASSSSLSSSAQWLQRLCAELNDAAVLQAQVETVTSLFDTDLELTPADDEAMQVVVQELTTLTARLALDCSARMARSLVARALANASGDLAGGSGIASLLDELHRLIEIAHPFFSSEFFFVRLLRAVIHEVQDLCIERLAFHLRDDEADALIEAAAQKAVGDVAESGLASPSKGSVWSVSKRSKGKVAAVVAPGEVVVPAAVTMALLRGADKQISDDQSAILESFDSAREPSDSAELRLHRAKKRIDVAKELEPLRSVKMLINARLKKHETSQLKFFHLVWVYLRQRELPLKSGLVARDELDQLLDANNPTGLAKLRSPISDGVVFALSPADDGVRRKMYASRAAVKAGVARREQSRRDDFRGAERGREMHMPLSTTRELRRWFPRWATDGGTAAGGKDSVRAMLGQREIVQGQDRDDFIAKRQIAIRAIHERRATLTARVNIPVAAKRVEGGDGAGGGEEEEIGGNMDDWM